MNFFFLCKIESLRHSGSAGHMNWNDLKVWAKEMLSNLGPQGPQGEAMQTNVSEGTQPEEKPVCLIQEDIDAAFSVDNVSG